MQRGGSQQIQGRNRDCRVREAAGLNPPPPKKKNRIYTNAGCQLDLSLDKSQSSQGKVQNENGLQGSSIYIKPVLS